MTSGEKMVAGRDLNPRHADYDSAALTSWSYPATGRRNRRLADFRQDLEASVTQTFASLGKGSRYAPVFRQSFDNVSGITHVRTPGEGGQRGVRLRRDAFSFYLDPEDLNIRLAGNDLKLLILNLPAVILRGAANGQRAEENATNSMETWRSARVLPKLCAQPARTRIRQYEFRSASHRDTCFVIRRVGRRGIPSRG